MKNEHMDLTSLLSDTMHIIAIIACTILVISKTLMPTSAATVGGGPPNTKYIAKHAKIGGIARSYSIRNACKVHNFFKTIFRL